MFAPSDGDVHSLEDRRATEEEGRPPSLRPEGRLFKSWLRSRGWAWAVARCVAWFKWLLMVWWTEACRQINHSEVIGEAVTPVLSDHRLSGAPSTPQFPVPRIFYFFLPHVPPPSPPTPNSQDAFVTNSAQCATPCCHKISQNSCELTEFSHSAHLVHLQPCLTVHCGSHKWEIKATIWFTT